MLRCFAPLQAARAARFPLVREIFAMFDEDRDGVLKEKEYRFGEGRYTRDNGVVSRGGNFISGSVRERPKFQEYKEIESGYV